MSLRVRLEKILFIVQEMHLALAMAERSSTDFSARAIARHVLIRTKDFIEHTAAILQPLRDAGIGVQSLRSVRKAYMDAFEEYFATTRTKLSAHVQDIEFLERLELWSDIEVVKLSYFVDGAREIYEQHLSQLTGITCRPWTCFPEASSSVFFEVLDKFFAEADSGPSVVRMGTDMLAATRPQTVSLLNFSPTHVRAGQLACIHLWVVGELALLDHLHGHVNAERILRARLFTDIVSFGDCLVTRTSGDPAHRLTGLDNLLRNCADRAADPSAIDEFRNATRFDEQLEQLRLVRNHVGAHFHVDTAASVNDLVASVDAADVKKQKRFYVRLFQVFRLTCKRTFFLSEYTINGAILQGISNTQRNSSSIKPFGRVSIPNVEPTSAHSLSEYDEDTMSKALGLWLEGGENASLGKSYFWNAFMYSPVVELFTPDWEETSHIMPNPIEFRKAHAHVLRALTLAATEAEGRGVLELVSECAGGYPPPLALLLQRALDSGNSAVANVEVLEVLGELPVTNGAWARVPLVRGLESSEPLVVAIAAGALYRRLAQDRVVQQPEALPSVFETEVAPLLQRAGPIARLLATLVIASLFTVPVLPESVIEGDSAAVRLALSTLAQKVLGLAESDRDLGLGLQSRDCVGLSVYFGEILNRQGHGEDAMIFFRAAATGAVRLSSIAGVRAQASVNLALAYLHVGEKDSARRVARAVIDDSVLEPATQFHAMEVLLASGGDPNEVRTDIEDVERFYKLDAQELVRAEELRRRLDQPE